MPAALTCLFTSLCLGHAFRLKEGLSAEDDALQVIVLNTPKCATGSLQKMFLELMPCPQQEKELGPNHVMKSCPGTGSWVYRSHGVNESVAYFEKHPELKFGGNHGRCAVVSSFRNPASWLKSLYFEGRKQELCDGVDDVAGVISDFEEYLLHRVGFSAFKAGAVAALFGLNDFPALMKQTAKGGGFYHLPANSFPQSPFAQCELFFLQVEEMDHSHEHFLAQWPEIKPMQHEAADDVCPNSQNIRDALKAHVIRPESMSRLFSKNHFVEQAWNFYETQSSTHMPTLQVIVLNTPKCGTGSLQKMFLELMPCPKQEKELGPNHVMKSCPGTGSWVYRSHEVNESVAYFEEHPELKFGGNHGRCAVLSSFRNPASWLKSLYFEGRKQELCNGVNDVAGVISDFEEYLLHRFDISAFKAGAVAALFGLNDFPALMTQTAQGGGFYHLPANSFPQGPFGQCELFFLQVEEMGRSHENFLAQWPEIKPMQHEATDDVCPNSQNIRDALKAHVIRPESKARLFAENPFVEQAWNFYEPQ